MWVWATTTLMAVCMVTWVWISVLHWAKWTIAYSALCRVVYHVIKSNFVCFLGVQTEVSIFSLFFVFARQNHKPSLRQLLLWSQSTFLPKMFRSLSSSEVFLPEFQMSRISKELKSRKTKKSWIGTNESFCSNVGMNNLMIFLVIDTIIHYSKIERDWRR